MVAPLLIVSSSGWACTSSMRREGVTRSILQRPGSRTTTPFRAPSPVVDHGVGTGDTAGHAANPGDNPVIDSGTVSSGRTTVSPLYSTSTGTTVRASAKWQAEGW